MSESSTGEKNSLTRDLVMLGLVAPLAGLGAGFIGSLFRLALGEANRFRDLMISRLGGSGFLGLLVFVGLAAGAAALAAWMVRNIAPSAAGSGIPRVMSVLAGEEPPAPARVIPVKFVAGTLAIGSGLALGREGPTVQMGASIAYQTGKLFRLSWASCRSLLAAGAGAGFAVAFNAPMAGVVLVFEGLLRQFDVKSVIAALAASAAAVWVGRAFFGVAPEFSVSALTDPGWPKVPFFVLLGIVAGLAGVLYNRTLLGALRITDRYPRLPVELRAALVGAGLAGIAWFAPKLVGDGGEMAQHALSGAGTLAVLPILFLFRLGLIAVSVAAGTPGGLLVPFLALGAELGLWFGLLCEFALPGMHWEPTGFALVGMAALFTAILRAPLTAVVLVTELTANQTLVPPMVIACFAAMLIPTLIGDKSILESLKERAQARSRGTAGNGLQPQSSN